MKKIILVLIGFFLIAGLVFAGGKKEEPASSAPKEVKLRFAWWGGDARHKATLAALELYTQKNPNVKIEGEYGGFGTFYQKLLTQLNGGTAPDMFQVDFKWVYDLLSQNKSWFVNMTTLSDKIDMSGIDMKFAMDWASMDNFLIGLPLGLNGIGLAYNKDLITKAGVNINDSWDWNDLLEAGEKVKKLGPGKHAIFFGKDYFTYMLKVMIKQKTGNDLIKPDYSLGFTKSEITEVFAFILKMVDTGTIPPLEETVPFEKVFPDQTPNWLNQNYAICSTSASILPVIRSTSKFDIGVARYPVMKNAKNPGLITAPTMLMALNAKSPNQEEAVKFVNWFMNSDESILTLKDVRGLPSVKKARELLIAKKLLDENISHMVETALPFSGGPEGALSQNQEVITVVADYIQQVGFRKLTPDKAADGFMQDLTAKAAEMKKK